MRFHGPYLSGQRSPVNMTGAEQLEDTTFEHGSPIGKTNDRHHDYEFSYQSRRFRKTLAGERRRSCPPEARALRRRQALRRRPSYPPTPRRVSVPLPARLMSRESREWPRRRTGLRDAGGTSDVKDIMLRLFVGPATLSVMISQHALSQIGCRSSQRWIRLLRVGRN